MLQLILVASVATGNLGWLLRRVLSLLVCEPKQVGGIQNSVEICVCVELYYNTWNDRG